MNLLRIINRFFLFRYSALWLNKIGITGQWLLIAIPFIWLVCFFFIPFIFVAKISLSEIALARPPYLPLVEWVNQEKLVISLNISNYFYIFDDLLYLDGYLNSIKVASVSTFWCLIIGFPLAYYIARSTDFKRNILLMLVILPFWTSFLLRIYAWIGILKNNGLFNNFLIFLGIIDEPITILQTNVAVYIGIVYTYLPFMILPLYANLVKLDHSFIEAAEDLGAKPYKVFFTIILPLSLPGIIAGSALVFIPTIGEFVIPALLGGPDTLMIGKIIWDEFFGNRDWPVASAITIAILILIVIPIGLLKNLQRVENK